MDINNSIKLNNTSKSKDLLTLEYRGWEFEYVIGDSRMDVRTMKGNWISIKLNGNPNKACAMKTAKEYLTIKGVE